jgi:hypothetical protein
LPVAVVIVGELVLVLRMAGAMTLCEALKQLP